MFMHWKITGLRKGTTDENVVDALIMQTTVNTATPNGFDAEGGARVTVYFPAHMGDSPELRIGLRNSYQALLRHRLSAPNLTIEDVTKQ